MIDFKKLEKMLDDELSKENSVKDFLKRYGCKYCHHNKISQVLTPDPFDMVEKWHCDFYNRTITEYHDKYDKEKIPNWCKQVIIL